MNMFLSIKCDVVDYGIFGPYIYRCIWIGSIRKIEFVKVFLSWSNVVLNITDEAFLTVVLIEIAEIDDHRTQNSNYDA